MAGYSKRELWKKLGIKDGMEAIVLKPPTGYSKKLGNLPKGVVLRKKLKKNAEFIHYFAKHKRELERDFPKLKKALTPAGIIWISWPKLTSGVSTDVTWDAVHVTGLKNGLVDIKVAAIDDIWSGLKFVYRLKDRK